MARDTRAKKLPYFEPDEAWMAKHKNAILALQALYEGKANEGQQQHALKFILEDLCDRMGNQYFPTQRDTDFALGKKFVGDHIVGAINAKTGQIKEPKNDRRNTR